VRPGRQTRRSNYIAECFEDYQWEIESGSGRRSWGAVNLFRGQNGDGLWVLDRQVWLGHVTCRVMLMHRPCLHIGVTLRLRRDGLKGICKRLKQVRPTPSFRA
jgi:hypothetical protein